MALTLFSVQNAKPKDRPYKLTDGDGLHLLVNPNGSKLWRLRYRFGDKQNMLSFGAFPEVTLASAREKRDDARKLLADGKDPSLQKKLEKIASQIAAANTFGTVAEEYLAKLKAEGRAETTVEKNRWLLIDLASPLYPLPSTHCRG